MSAFRDRLYHNDYEYCANTVSSYSQLPLLMVRIIRRAVGSGAAGLNGLYGLSGLQGLPRTERLHGSTFVWPILPLVSDSDDEPGYNSKKLLQFWA